MTQQKCHAHSRHHLVSLSRAAFPSDFFLIRISFNFFCEILIRIFLQLLMRKSPISSAANNLLSLFANMEPLKSFARTPLQRPLMQNPFAVCETIHILWRNCFFLHKFIYHLKRNKRLPNAIAKSCTLHKNYPTEQKKKSRVRICSRSNVFKSYF